MIETFDLQPHVDEEGIPPSPSPERPPLAPYDPPAPAPQAAAWDRALRVIFIESANRGGDTAPMKSRTWRANRRGRAAVKSVRRQPSNASRGISTH
jgi:hypothetical protein